MAFVLDSSVALAWLLPDERGEATDALADRLEQEPVHVPAFALLLRWLCCRRSFSSSGASFRGSISSVTPTSLPLNLNGNW